MRIVKSIVIKIGDKQYALLNRAASNKEMHVTAWCKQIVLETAQAELGIEEKIANTNEPEETNNKEDETHGDEDRLEPIQGELLEVPERRDAQPSPDRMDDGTDDVPREDRRRTYSEIRDMQYRR